MALKPWYKVVVPREDLREGRPLDASEFAVHLDKVRDGTAPEDYRDARRFFERTYLTASLVDLGAQMLRRLSGITTETSAVFNMATQFGGGKTHALTLLYHLATCGRKAEKFAGVDRLLDRAGVDHVPKAAVAVFVGTEFDSTTGRGGEDGTPLRKTPWGEIAWQLGSRQAFAKVAEHERRFVEPKGDVIRAFLPKDKPCLILMDEIISYVSTYRKYGYHNCLYNFIQALSETARSLKNVVLVVSIPSSVISYTDADEADEQRFKHMLNRVGKAMKMAAHEETSEIIRRRLFEWGGLPAAARRVAAEYADWSIEPSKQQPQWFPVDNAREAIESSYPFHPSVLSVFRRKWRGLPRFQETRGILRLLALWVARAYQEGYKGAHKDPLIGLGTAPLDDPIFRTAVFEELGEQKLEGAVTTDICGARGSHATRLDAEATDAIKKARLHRKVATVVFFESNGGQAKGREATVPEIRLATAEPGLDLGNIETALEALSETCYYLRVERNRYRFGLAPNLNKLLADRRANIASERIEERIRSEILKVFQKQPGVEVIPFAEKSNDIPDRPVLSLVVLPPHRTRHDEHTQSLIETMIREYGSSGRTFKSALLFVVPEDVSALREEARRLLAWQDIKDEEEDRLDDAQRAQLSANLKKAQRDLKECVWRTYKNVLLLDKDNTVKTIDLGLVHSSQAASMVKLILERLEQDGQLEPSGISPNFLVRNWPPAFTEWSTKAVRDACFASPQFPRLLDGNSVKDTIAKGVSAGILAYVGKQSGGGYKPFVFQESITPADIEISDDMYIITAEEAKKHIEPPRLTALTVHPEYAQVKPGARITFKASGLDQHGQPMPVSGVAWMAQGGDVDQDGNFKAGPDEGEFLVEASVDGLRGQAKVNICKAPVPTAPPAPENIRGLRWSGQVPAQKWMNFYTKVLARYATTGGLELTVSFEVTPEEGLPEHHVEETKSRLRDLGLDDDVQPIT